MYIQWFFHFLNVHVTVPPQIVQKPFMTLIRSIQKHVSRGLEQNVYERFRTVVDVLERNDD